MSHKQLYSTSLNRHSIKINYQCCSTLFRVAVRFSKQFSFSCAVFNCGNFFPLDRSIVRASRRLNCVLQLQNVIALGSLSAAGQMVLYKFNK